MPENFWEHVDNYRRLGFDAIRWIPTCGNEIEPAVLADAARESKRSSVKLVPSWFEPFYHIEGKKPELTRRVYSLDGAAVDKEIEVKRAITMLRVQASAAESAESLSQVFERLLKPFSAKVSATCTAAVTTEHPDAQFAMFDYIELHRGDKTGYMPAVATCTMATDITRDPDAEVHTDIAMTSAIEILNLLGCGVSSGFKIFPAYDAPTEDILDRIRSNLDAFTSRYNLAMEDYSSLKVGKLFYGATAMATTTKELPVRYSEAEEGMVLLVTNKFGGLAALSLYTLARLDSENIIKFETSGTSFESITKARDEATKNLSEPHFVLGKIISKFSPDYGSAFDKNSHVLAVYPVGTRGVLSVGALAALTNSQIAVSAVPVRQEEIARFATHERLVENATASLNGCHLIVASADAAQQIMDELRKHNFSPERIGTLGKKGSPLVTFDAGTGIEEFVAAKAKLDRLSEAPPAAEPAGQIPSTP